jgi:hypothetical protein
MLINDNKICEIVFSSGVQGIDELLKKAISSRRCWGYQFQESDNTAFPLRLDFNRGRRGNCASFSVVPFHRIPAQDFGLYTIGESGAVFYNVLLALSSQIEGSISYVGPDYFFEFENGEAITKISFELINEDQYPEWIIERQRWETACGNEVDLDSFNFVTLLYDLVNRLTQQIGQFEYVATAFSLAIASTILEQGDFANLYQWLKVVRDSNHDCELKSFGKFICNSNRPERGWGFAPAPELKTFFNSDVSYSLDDSEWPLELKNAATRSQIENFVQILKGSSEPVTIGIMIKAQVVNLPGMSGRNPKTGEKVSLPPQASPSIKLLRVLP